MSHETFSSFSCETVSAYTLEYAQDIVNISRAMRGDRRCIVLLDKDDIVREMKFCEPGQEAAVKDEYAKERAELIELNEEMGLYIADATSEQLEHTREVLMHSLEQSLAKLQ